MCVPRVPAIRRPRAHHASAMVARIMLALRNNAGGKGRQCTARVNSKYSSPNLLHGARMYSKLVSEIEET